MPLRQMGGCKRKRSPSANPQNEEGNSTSDEEPSIEDTVAPLVNVAPNSFGWDNENNKKRKNKFKNKKKKKKLKTDHYNPQEQTSYQPGALHYQKNKQRFNKNNPNAQNTSGPPNPNLNKNTNYNNGQKNKFKYQPNKNKNQSNQQQQNQTNPNKQQHSPNKKKFNQNKQHNQQFAPFDYSSFNFNQFQGGGSNVSQASKVKTSFRGKVRLIYTIINSFRSR